MEPLVVALSALGGLVAGDLLEPVVDQVPQERTLRRPWWRCGSCGVPSPGLGQVPILRVMSRQRPCDACGELSGHRWRPLVLALSGAVLCAALGARLGGHLDLVAYDVLAIGLLAITAIDLERYLVPVRVLYPTLVSVAVLLACASVLDGRLDALWRSALVGVACFAAFLAIHLIQPKGMGFGDVRLAGLVGFSSGWLGTGWHAASRAGVAFFVAFVLGAVVGLVVMAVKGTGRKTKVPFAPFLAAGTLASVLWGAQIARLWLGSLH